MCNKYTQGDDSSCNFRAGPGGSQQVQPDGSEWNWSFRAGPGSSQQIQPEGSDWSWSGRAGPELRVSLCMETRNPTRAACKPPKNHHLSKTYLKPISGGRR